jgi:uncharacterized protein (TIGR02466 family)
MNKLNQFDYFPSSVYTVDKPEFLDKVKIVSNQRLNSVQVKDELHPIKMTNNFMNEEYLNEFKDYVLNTAWEILKSQGYAMEKYKTVLIEMWTQEHQKGSSMETHLHGNGVQLVGFYFLDAPEDSTEVTFYDARLAKMIINLPEADPSKTTAASNGVKFKPKPGLLMFTNAHLPHSFTRNRSDEAVRFVHINVNVELNE